MLAIAEAHDEVFCSVGTHPHNAAARLDVTTDELVRLSAHPKVVAIGKPASTIITTSRRDRRRRRASTLSAAARQTGLPLVIHARSADDDIAAILEEESGQGAFPFILHCFSSGRRLARWCSRSGGYVSFSGIPTKFGRTALDRAAGVPRERLLVETDAPYLAPVPFRGKRNEPAYVADTARVLAETVGVSQEQVRSITTDNAFFRLFKKMPRPAKLAA